MTVISDLPKGILSERVLESIKGRRLLALVFTTFRLEPNFFEAEILPAFIDQSFSHALPIRLVQLEETLRAVPAGIAVYYDQAGLVADGAGAKLDVRRIPVRYDKGIFHPKNAFVLVEEVAADADGRHPRSLLCLCASANLTRAGWWENVEVAHIEEVRSGDRSHLRDEVMNYLDALVGIVEGQRADHRLQKRHVAVNAIRRFLQDEVASRENATSNGRLYSRLITSQPGT